MPTMSIRCGTCGDAAAATVVAGSAAPGSTAWLVCPSCEEGSVKLRDGIVYPTAPAGGPVPNLPEDVAHAWREVRTTHAVGAYTASEMVCRKILMHIAVDVAGAKAGKGFVEYVETLESAGYLTTGMKPAVDKIKDRGNTVNHELPASTEEESRTTMAITEHLLRSIYEIPAL